MIASSAAVGTDDEIKMASLVDDINAYSFLYPVELPLKKFVFKWYALLDLKGMPSLRSFFFGLFFIFCQQKYPASPVFMRMMMTFVM